MSLLDPDPRDLETIRKVRAKSPVTMLGFSRGKDSIASWLRIRDHFDQVVAYHYYVVPDLEFVEESLQYFERFFGTTIIRLPGSLFYRALGRKLYQPPHRVPMIDSWALAEPEDQDLRDAIREDFEIPRETYTANGIRASDSLNRRATLSTTGTVIAKEKVYMPIAWMTMDQLIATMSHAGCKIPIDYLWFGRTFDGLGARYLSKIREYAPNDYRRILEWFPLAELELFRAEQMWK